MKESVFSVLENYLCGVIGKDEAEEEIEQLDELPSKIYPIFRTINCYETRKEEDFLANLRQCIVYARNAIRVNQDIYDLCRKNEKEYGFFIDSERRSINAVPILMNEMPDLRFSYMFMIKRKN